MFQKACKEHMGDLDKRTITGQELQDLETRLVAFIRGEFERLIPVYQTMGRNVDELQYMQHGDIQDLVNNYTK